MAFRLISHLDLAVCRLDTGTNFQRLRPQSLQFNRVQQKFLACPACFSSYTTRFRQHSMLSESLVAIVTDLHMILTHCCPRTSSPTS